MELWLREESAMPFDNPCHFRSRISSASAGGCETAASAGAVDMVVWAKYCRAVCNLDVLRHMESVLDLVL